MRYSRQYLRRWLGLVVGLALALGACNYPGPQATEPPGDVLGTSAAQTVAADLTEVAVASPPAPAPSDTPAPAADTPVPTNTQVPPSPTSGTAGCTDKATFVTDVTVPDNTYLDSGASFTKTWRLQNVGTCTWNTGYALVFDSGNAMGGPGSVSLPASVAPNATIDLSINLTAPTSNGNYKGNYKLRNDKGIVFGIGANADVAFWVLINVGPTPTAGPTVYHSGKINLQQSYSADFDTVDDTPSSGTEDIWFHAVSAAEMYLEPQNGAKFKLITTGAPSYDKCSTASLSSSPVSMDDVSIDDWLCFKTNDGRYGRAQIENISGDPKVIRLDIVTWKK
jgi:Ig-like domain from next to BRCA1 gene